MTTRTLTVAGALLCLLGLLFLLAEAFDVGALEDPSGTVEGGGIAPALIAEGLLLADAVLPVASSLVMVSLGAIYGPVLGIALAWAGRVGMTLLGLAIGRRGRPWLERLVPAGDRERAESLLARWGMLAIVVTRPVPLIAETTAIMAGAHRLSWRRGALAAAVGALPEAVAYGLAGALAHDAPSAALIWAALLLAAALVWAVARGRRQAPA